MGGEDKVARWQLGATAGAEKLEEQRSCSFNFAFQPPLIAPATAPKKQALIQGFGLPVDNTIFSHRQPLHLSFNESETIPMSNLAKAFNTMAQDDDRFANVLMKALEDKNLEGFDYLEFKQSVAKMEEIGMDHDTAIRAAFGTGSTVGLTLEKLVKTAKYYTEVLQDEKSKFMNSMEKHLMSNVEGKAKETSELKKKIANWESKIEQLKAEVVKAKAKIESADELISTAKEKQPLIRKVSTMP